MEENAMTPEAGRALYAKRKAKAAATNAPSSGTGASDSEAEASQPVSPPASSSSMSLPPPATSQTLFTASSTFLGSEFDPLSEPSSAANLASSPSPSPSPAPLQSTITPPSPAKHFARPAEKPAQVSQYFRRFELLLEYKNLGSKKQCPRGVYVIPSNDNFYVWYGVMFLHECAKIRLHGTPIVIKFQVLIPEEYPEKCPEIKVLSKIHHPLIDLRDGKLDMRTQFQDWRPDQNRICHVLHFFKNSFSETVLSSLQPENCPNKEAYKMMRQDPERFKDIVRNWAQETYREASNDHDGQALKLDVTEADVIKAADQIFQDAPCLARSESENITGFVENFRSSSQQLLARARALGGI